MEEFAEIVHANRILTYVSPLLILIGTIGNILTIAVLSRWRMRKSSTAIFLIALGVSDIVFLNTGSLRQWIMIISKTDIRTSGNVVCKIHVFLVYLSMHCSSWLLVAVTCERFLGVWLPLKVKQWCTPKKALIVIVILVGLLILVDCNLLFELSLIQIKINNETSIRKCYTSPEYDANWHWIHLCVFCLIPFAILLIGNCSIIARLFKARNFRRSQTSTKSLKVDKTRQVSTLLVVLNIAFFVNTLPLCIFLILYQSMHGGSKHDQAKRKLFFAIVNMFVSLNSAMNFVLYFLTGSRFRAELKTLFCNPKKSKDIYTSKTTIWSTSATETSSQL